jgi:small-conductance mechanosensitive channel
LSRLIDWALGSFAQRRPAFWVRQALHLATAALLLLGVLSIWFDDPTRLATAFGLVAAGLAFALQRVVTSVAGYFVILKGPIFDIGDRIAMGGVRGDVIALGFTQTTIMEMGQPPGVKTEPPEVWVRSRQYTGRIVSVPNAKIFDEAVYNYSRDFPYIWEEIMLPISYSSDRDRAERILLDVVERHCPPVDLSPDDLNELKRRYPVDVANLKSEVYYRLTDNWLELTARFVTREYGVRKLKDAISRDLIRELDAAGIGIASATFEIVGLPKLDVKVEGASGSTA